MTRVTTADVVNRTALRTPKFAAVLSTLRGTRVSLRYHPARSSGTSIKILAPWLIAIGLGSMTTDATAMDVSAQVAAWGTGSKAYHGVVPNARLAHFPSPPSLPVNILRRQEAMMISGAILRIAYRNRVDRQKDNGAFIHRLETEVLSAADLIAPGRALYTLTPPERNAVATTAILSTLPEFLAKVDETFLLEHERKLKPLLTESPDKLQSSGVAEAFRRAIHGLPAALDQGLISDPDKAEIFQHAALAAQTAMEKFNTLSRYEDPKTETITTAETSSPKPF